MSVEPEYDGPHLSFPLREEDVLAMLEHFKVCEDSFQCCSCISLLTAQVDMQSTF